MAGSSILRPSKLRRGYLQVIISYPEGRKGRTVHSLVAEAWIGKRPKGAVINHKDGNKTNNYYRNLEYTTEVGNMQHASDTGLLPKGSRHYTTELTEKDIVKVCKLILKGHGNKAISERTPVSASKVRDIRGGRSWVSVSSRFLV